MQAPMPQQQAPMPQQQAPVSTTQRVAPPWQGKFALFTSKPGSKFQYSGTIGLPAAELPAIIAYLQSCQPDQYGHVQLWLTGFLNTSKTGQQYIGGYAAPQTQGAAVTYAQQQTAASSMVGQVAASPAPAPIVNGQAWGQQAPAGQAFIQGAQPAMTDPAPMQNPPF